MLANVKMPASWPYSHEKDFSQGGTQDTQDADNSPETSLSAKTEKIDLQTQSASVRVSITLEKGIDTRKCVYAPF